MSELTGKWVLILPCHNQEEIIKVTLERVKQQSMVPAHVIVVDDHSDTQTLRDSEDGWLRVIHGAERGRSTTRNRGIQEAMDMEADVISFMDGDSLPEDYKFFERLEGKIDAFLPQLVFGTRVHSERPYDMDKWSKGKPTFFKRNRNYPSDLLTANMDNLQHHKPLEYRDLRVVAQVIDSYNRLKTFHEKVDFMLTGMVSWSCNFTVTAQALIRIRAFMNEVYGIDTWFDDVTFKSKWGYEDVAFGIDALYAGVRVYMQDYSRVIHFMHGRSDELFTHVHGKHLVMERYRHILKKLGQIEVPEDNHLDTGDIILRQGHIVRKGRKHMDPRLPDKVPLIVFKDMLYKGSEIYDLQEAGFKFSIRAFILSILVKLFYARKP